MTKDEFLKFISGEGKAVYDEVISEQGLSILNRETVEKFLTGTNDGIAISHSIGDKRVNSYKSNGEFARDFDEEYKKRNPGLTEEQKKILDMETKIKTFERNEKISANKKELTTLRDEYGLPEDYFELMVGEDLEGSKNNIINAGSKYKSNFDAALEKALKDKLAGAGKPAGGGTVDINPGLAAFNEALGISK